MSSLRECCPCRCYLGEAKFLGVNRHKNEYNRDVKENAKPCFPVEYLLVNVSHREFGI